VTLEEAIKVAEELAEWYVEGMGNVHDIAYERQKRDLDMLEFFISLGKEQSEPCGDPCFPLSGGSYSCGREKGHDGLHASLYGNGATWDGNTVTEGLLLARTFLKIINKGGKKSDPNSPGEGFRRGGYLGDAID